MNIFELTLWADFTALSKINIIALTSGCESNILLFIKLNQQFCSRVLILKQHFTVS